MANAKHVERRLARLKVKYASKGGSPRQLRRKAQVATKRDKQAAGTLALGMTLGAMRVEEASKELAKISTEVPTPEGLAIVVQMPLPP